MTRHRPPQDLSLRARSLPSKVVIASSWRSVARSKQAPSPPLYRGWGDPSDLRGLVEWQRLPRHIDSRGPRGPERGIQDQQLACKRGGCPRNLQSNTLNLTLLNPKYKIFRRGCTR